jgi:hypothetical protein
MMPGDVPKHGWANPRRCSARSSLRASLTMGKDQYEPANACWRYRDLHGVISGLFLLARLLGDEVGFTSTESHLQVLVVREGVVLKSGLGCVSVVLLTWRSFNGSGRVRRDKVRRQLRVS